MPIKSFKELAALCLSKPPVNIAIAAGEDISVIQGAVDAHNQGFVEKVVVTGNATQIEKLISQVGGNTSYFEIIHTQDAAEAACKAVAAIYDHQASILVKGMLDTSIYFKAILNKTTGIRGSGTLSNITTFEMPSYHKLLTVTDNAIILLPNLEQKKCLILNTERLYHALGIDKVKVGVIAAIEKIDPKMQATVDAAELKLLSLKGPMQNFMIDGPFGYDACICKEAAILKKLSSEVAGDPDLLLMPNLEAANVLGKALKFHGNAKSGGLILGAAVPAVLNSRSDSPARRLNSLLLAKAISQAES